MWDYRCHSVAMSPVCSLLRKPHIVNSLLSQYPHRGPMNQIKITTISLMMKSLLPFECNAWWGILPTWRSLALLSVNTDVHCRHQYNMVDPLCREEAAISDADSCIDTLFHFMPLSQIVFVSQPVCRGGGRVVVCVCNSQSLSLHDCGCTQATGLKHPKPEMCVFSFSFC